MSLRICVDKLDDVSFAGNVFNVVENPIPFASFQDFIVKIDKFLDACGHPQSSIEKRSMKEQDNVGNHYSYNLSKVREFNELLCYQGKVKTFNLDIQTRSRGDWQGRIAVEDGAYEPFHTILELMQKILKQKDM